MAGRDPAPKECGMTTDDLMILLGGLKLSAWYAVLSIATGLPLGLVLGLLGTAPSRLVRWTTLAVVELLRGLPLLVVVYLIYFGLPSIDVVLDAGPALVTGLAISAAAYTSEIFRVGILDVPNGQREAARSLGLTGWHELRHVVLPQALSIVRLPVISFAVLIFQYTAIGFAIGLPELLARSYGIGSVTFDYLTVFLVAGGFYAAVSIVASALIHVLRRDKSGPAVLPA
ncbi:ABC transporter permease subunit [Aeromicrobium sp. zg-629]|nr:ABC transporter permease subunit [Aeromicrobium senzhongii]